jgi:N12 class adenine-specific DNA methylase
MAVNPDDPLTWDLSSTTSEAPKTEPVDEKNPLTWEMSKSSIFPKEAIPQPEEPGYVGSLAKGLGAGLKYGLPQLLSQATEKATEPFLAEGAVSPAHAISDWAEEGQKKTHPEPYKNWAKEQLYQTGAMTAPSVLPSAAIGLLGLPAAAAMVPAALFGLSQAQQTTESAKQRMTDLQKQHEDLIAQGDPEGKAKGIQDQMDQLRKNAVPASLITGAIETFGETLGTIYLSRLFGPLAPMFTKGAKTTVGEIAKPTLRRFLRELPKTIGVEAGTEVFQNWTEAEAEKRLAVRPEAVPWEEGVAAIAPTVGMTLLTGGVAHPFEKVHARRIENALTQRTSRQNVEERIGAVNEIYSKIDEADKEVAAKWRERAYQSVLKGEPIPLDADIMEWAGVPHLPKEEAKAAEPGQKAPAKTAIPEEAPPLGAPPESEKPFDMTKKTTVEPEQEVEKPQDLQKTTEEPPETRAIDLTQTPEEREKAAEEVTPPAPPEIKQAGTNRPTAAIPEEKPAEAIPQEEAKIQASTRGYFPAEKWWESKVSDMKNEWDLYMGEIQEKENELQKKAKPLQEELASLKGKRDKESKAKKQGILQKLDALFAPIAGKTQEAEDAYIAESEKFLELAKQEAQNRGVSAEDLDNFLEYYAEGISPQRPAIEHNYQMTPRQIFEDLLKDYLAPKEGKAPTAGDIGEKVEEAAGEAAKRLAAAEPEMVEPGATPERKTATPETEKPSRETVMKDLIAGRITPTQAAATLGVEVSDLKKEVQKEISQARKEQKEKPQAEETIPTKEEPKEIKAAGTNRPTAPKAKEEEAKAEPEAENPEEKHVAEIAVAKLPDRISEKGQEIWKRYLNRMVGILDMKKYEPGKLPLSTLENARAWFLKLYDAGRKGEPEPMKIEGVKINALEREVYQAGKEEAGKKQELKKAGAGPEKGKEEKSAETPRMDAIGAITGGKVKMLEERGHEIIRGEMDEAARQEFIGVGAGSAIDRLKELNVTLKMKPAEAPPKLGPEGEKAWAEWEDTFTKDMPADKYKRLRDLFEEIYQAGKEGRPPIKNGQTFKMSDMERNAWDAGDADREEKPTEPPKATGNRWLRNPQTGKIELYFNKADFDKLQDKVKERIRVRFLWAPSKKAWVSKATKDMFWPETIVRDLTTLGVFGKQEAPKAEKAGAEKPAAGEKKADIEAEVSKLTEEDLDEMLDEAFEEGKPEKEKQGMPTVEGNQARPYSSGIIEKPRSEDLGITKKDPKMGRATIGEEKAWTDGHMLDRGELPYKTEGKIHNKVNDATELWNDAVAKDTHALGDPWVFIPATSNHQMDIMVWGTQVSAQPLAVDLDYFNYFKSQYPDAEFFYGEDKKVKGDKRTFPGEILVKSGGKPVGLVMPVRNTWLSFDDVEGFRPKGTKFVPPHGWETNLMKARMYANALKIPHVGKKLEELVIDITTKLTTPAEKGWAWYEGGHEPPPKKEKAAKSLTQILKDVSALGVKGADEAMKGLYELFGGSALKSFPAGFDSETYAKAKPHFEASFKAFKEAGLGLKEFLAEMRKQLGDKIKPYLRYFIQEKMGEAEELPSAEEDQPDLTENTGKGERGARKKLTEQEKAEKAAKEEAAAAKKAKKAGMGEFKNVGYVYDPEHLNKKTKDKAPRSAGKIILDEMTPAKLWDVEFADGATHGVVRLKDQVQNMFKTFREYLLYKSEIRSYGGRRASMETKLDAWFTRGQGNIEKLKEWAKEYGRTIQPYITAFEGQTSITGAIGGLQQTAYPGVGIKFPWPQTKDQISKEWKTPPLHNYQFVNEYLKFGSERYMFDFLKDGWKSLLGQENEILLSEIDIHKRGRNKNVVRAGLPDYREGVELKKTEDFQAPFGFKGVGFGEEGWINQEERNRIIPAAYDAFKDLAATIKAPDKGMSLGGDLAVQFANLGHKARGAAAAYFPSIKTINFTRDNGDGTMSHEWGHALHALAAPKAIDEINAIIKTLNHVYDFEAGERLANDLLAKDSPFLKRIISSKKQERIQAVKDRIKQEFVPTVKKETDYFKTAKQMDAEYTARNQEMWARAWEAFIHDTLAGTDNYLVTDFVAAGRVGGHAGVGTMLVYPAGKEREKFNETIQHFVDGLTWDENGKPFLKDDYETIDKHNEALLKAKLEELLATVEERYKAIWTSEPSKDGKFWYRYDATEFAPMMQPEGYVGYDKEYKGTEPTVQGGKGAVAYLTQLHPDLIMDFKLSNIKYEGKNPTYISAEEGGIPNGGLQEHGQTELGEERPGHGKGDEKAGDIRGTTGPGSPAGVGGARTPGKSGGAVRGGEGGRGEDTHPRGPGNYRITDPTLNDPKSIDRRFIANLAAVRILKELESTGREITPRDKDILAQYTGMGGFAELFAYEPSAGWKERADLLKGELDREEEQAAASSAPSAYYTPVPVGQFMWKLAQRLGFKGGLVLEPSMGANGLFFGTLPEELEKSTTLQGIEKDSISARIASRLYEKANIENKPFQETNKPNNRADLTIGNVPFQNFVVSDSKHNKGGFTLANYFVNKSLNLTAPGTLSMLITPTSTMDGGGANLKEYSTKADLVGAIRLPSGIYAGSDVVCDILVFRKKIEGSKFKGIATDVWTQASKDPTTGVMINKYFLDHPDMIAGKLEKVTGRYGDEAFRVAPEGNLEGNLARIAAAFPEKIVEREATKTIKSLDDLIAAPGTVKEGGIYVNTKGQVAMKEAGEEVLFPTATAGERQKAQIAKGFVKLLDQVRNVLRVQKTEIDKDLIKSAQEALKSEYDAFVKAHGPINSPSNFSVYNDATDSPWVLALEDYNPRTDKVVKLADIFTKEIIPSQEKPDHAETDHDALAMSLDEFGYPNLEYMAKLRKSDTVSVLKGVQDKVIENPETGFLETMDEYLSGNVKKKLQVARDMAESNPEYKRNVKVLEAAQPAEIPAHRITARIGASWIHPDHLSNYVKDKMALGNKLTALFHFSPVTNEWKMSFRGKEGYRGEVKAETTRQIYAAQKSIEATRMWGTPYRNFFLLMQDAIEGRRPIVSYYDRDLKKTVIDATATKGAEAKLNDIQRDFSRWLFADPSRGREAVERFNDLMNTSVPMISDGSHLTFPGKSLEVLTAKEAKTIGIAGTKVFYPHQPNAVWKYLRSGNLYLAHEMGAGKTMTMAMIGMEAKRLRGKKKVLYVTHSDSTMDQGISEIKRLYPLANVLPVRVSTNDERKQLAMQKIAMNDFDIAVMRQQDLDRIALSPDAERVFIQQDIQELREVLEDLKKQGANLQERDIQTRISALEEQLKETVHEEAKRKNLFFDDLGIDLLITDEAHSYKNVPYATRLSRITGLNPAGSPTARAFFRKTQYLNAAFPKRDAVVLGSGTPLTNSIAELYNIQRMLQPQEVKRQGVWNFDRWVANFGEIGSDLEWDGARGEYKNIVTNRRIVNAGRLLATAFQNVDSVLAKNTPIKRPKIRGGEPQRVKIKPNQYVEDYKAIVLERCKELEDDPRHAMFEGVPDNMLRIISNMSKVAIDQRLDHRYANTPMQQDSKIYQASRNIFKRWKEETEHKGVQLVFADLGVPHRFAVSFKPKSDEEIAKMTHEQLQEYLAAQYESENQSTGFNVYDGLKSELIKLGIPAKEIAFIHDADSANKDKKKLNLRVLFGKVNNGEIRLLIGSTSKAGTGVNVQERVSDVHHLDVWWNFSAWAQRNGRGSAPATSTPT